MNLVLNDFFASLPEPVNAASLEAEYIACSEGANCLTTGRISAKVEPAALAPDEEVVHAWYVILPSGNSLMVVFVL